MRPSVGTRVSYGTLHGYLEAYGPDAAALGVRLEIAAEERGPAILKADVQGQIVGDERVIFSHMMIVQSLPPGSYRLRAMVIQGNTLLTTLARAFEVAPAEASASRRMSTREPLRQPRPCSCRSSHRISRGRSIERTR